MESSLSSNAFARNPLFVLALAFAVGICFELAVDDRFLPVFFLLIAITASIFSKRARTLAVIFGFVFAGAFVTWLSSIGLPSNSLSRLYDDGWIASGDPVEIDATLTDQPRRFPDGFVIDAAVERISYKSEAIDTTGIVRIFSLSTSAADPGCRVEDLRAGNSVKISLRLKREESFRNPGTRSLIESLDQKGIAATGLVKSCLLVELRDPKTSWHSPFLAFREELTRRILHSQDRRSAGIILASMLGNRRYLTSDIADTFRENGTFHVLVISGLHITLIGTFLMVFFRRITRNRIVQFAASNSILWLYALVVGLQIPVLRASLMYTVFLLSQLFRTKFHPLNSLGAASLVVLVWRPEDLFSPSFQLTFLSVFGIIGFAFPVIKKLREIGSWMPSSLHPFPPSSGRPVILLAEALYWSDKRWKDYRSKQYWKCELRKTRIGRLAADSWWQAATRKTFEILLVTISVQVFTLPLLVVNFHRVGAGSLISNLFVGVLVIAQNAAALAAVLISILDFESAEAFSTIASNLTGISVLLQEAVTGILFQSWRVPVYTGAASSVYLLYFIPLLAITLLTAIWKPFDIFGPKYNLRWVRRTAFVSLVALGCVIVLHPFSAPGPGRRLTVDFLDVGQGDAALVTFPTGETMLVDGGGRRPVNSADKQAFEPDRLKIGEFVVSEFLWERGYSNVDFVLSTHPDADHIEGLGDVLRNFRVGTVLISDYFDGEPGFEELRKRANAAGVKFQQVREGFQIKFGPSTATFLNPPSNRIPSPGNSDSVVVRLEMGTRSVLLTGDIGAETESRLVSSGLLPPTDVVKAAHHGSRTSSTPEFVNRVEAEYVVIPVGKRSPYGHPHEEVTDRWEASGAKVVVIGLNGAVTVSTDGRDLRLTGFQPQKF